MPSSPCGASVAREDSFFGDQWGNGGAGRGSVSRFQERSLSAAARGSTLGGFKGKWAKNVENVENMVENGLKMMKMGRFFVKLA